MRCRTTTSAASSCAPAAAARLAQANPASWRSFCRPTLAVVSRCCARSSRRARNLPRRRCGRPRKPATSFRAASTSRSTASGTGSAKATAFASRQSRSAGESGHGAGGGHLGGFAAGLLTRALEGGAWPNFRSTARVVIIGGGAVGVSSLYHLAKAGWTDCVLLEKNELTSGSTWHAAGNVPTFSSSWSLMNMQRYSAELYRGLAERGRLSDELPRHRLAAARAHRRSACASSSASRAWAATRAWTSTSSALDEIKARYPFIETHDLKGALYDPNDGDIDPAQLTQALAKGARDMGAKIVRFCPVTGVRRDNGEWVVATPQGEIRCEYVVNAAGYRAREVGKTVRPRRADDGDEPSVHAVRGNPRARRLVEGARPASCRCCATSTPPTTCGRKRTA